MNADVDLIGTVIADYSLGRHRGLTDEETQERAERALSWLVEEVESLQAQLAEITEKPELTSPVKYYTDGKPYLQIGGFEMTDNPIVEACARLDRDEKYIIPHLQAQLAESQQRERAAVEFIHELRCDDSGDWGDIMFKIDKWREQCVKAWEVRNEN